MAISDDVDNGIIAPGWQTDPLLAPGVATDHSLSAPHALLAAVPADY